MCQMCVHEINAATGMLDELIRSYKADLDSGAYEGQPESQALMQLAGVMNQGVREHYGVINGQMVAVAIHRFATAVIVSNVSVNDEQVELAVITINERRRADGREDMVTADDINLILDAVKDLVT